MELAVKSGNDGTANCSERVIEVDEHTGTARLLPRRRRRRRDGPRCAIHQNRPSAEGGVMPTCPEGHASTSSDYCDVCGSPVRTAAVQPITPESAPTKACPACAAPISGRFCEACGHDSALPEPVPPTGRNIVGRMDGRRHRRPGVLRPCPRPRRPRHRRVSGVLPGTPNHPAGKQRADRPAQPGPGRGTRDRPRHPPGRPRRVHATRGDAHPWFGPHRHRPGIDQRHQPQRQRRPAGQRGRNSHSPTAIAYTSARGPRSRSFMAEGTSGHCPEQPASTHCHGVRKGGL